MNWDGYDYEPEAAVGPGPQDDPAVRELEPLILHLLEEQPTAVFYETQLCIHFEKSFFHWVTVRALKDLRESNRIGSELQTLIGPVQVRFYFHRRNRYWRRRAAEIRKLILEFSDQTFTNALGVQGELLVDAGVPRIGFKPLGSDIRAWNGVTWTETNHDLDRVFSRDDIVYGAEIKNRLGYIPRNEFSAKLRMCQALALVPLFIARMMPKTYMEEVWRAGGFCWIMKYQLYPLSHRDLARRVRQELSLPVDCPTRLQDSTLQRFLSWHQGKLRRLQ